MASVRHLPTLPYFRQCIDTLQKSTYMQLYPPKPSEGGHEKLNSPTPIVHLKDAKFGGTAARDCGFLLFLEGVNHHRSCQFLGHNQIT